MQVAILTDNDIFGLDIKLGLRLISWTQIFDVTAVISDDFDPLNIVSVFHWMFDLPYFDQNAAVGLLDYRDALFGCCVFGVLDQQVHWLTTADQFASADMKDSNDIAANAALLDLIFLYHN